MSRYRGKNGRFERCTVEKAFGIKTNEKFNRYKCMRCGDVFVPIIETGKCTICGGEAKLLEREEDQNG